MPNEFMVAAVHVMKAEDQQERVATIVADTLQRTRWTTEPTNWVPEQHADLRVYQGAVCPYAQHAFLAA
jgi:hypothetical protein